MAQLHFRNDLVSGPGGSEIRLDDPSGNRSNSSRLLAESGAFEHAGLELRD